MTKTSFVLFCGRPRPVGSLGKKKNNSMLQ